MQRHRGLNVKTCRLQIELQWIENYRTKEDMLALLTYVRRANYMSLLHPRNLWLYDAFFCEWEWNIRCSFSTQEKVSKLLHSQFKYEHHDNGVLLYSLFSTVSSTVNRKWRHIGHGIYWTENKKQIWNHFL